jgi:hypothetical protein
MAATYTPIKMCQAVLTAADVTYYTSPAAAPVTSTIIKQIVLSNTTAVNVTVTINTPAVSIAPLPANSVFTQVPVAAFTTVLIDMSAVLSPGDYLSAKCSAATSITMRASGVTIV